MMFSFSLQVSQAVHCLCACSPGCLILHIYTQTADQEGWSGCNAVSYVYTAVYTTLCLREAEVTAFMGMPWGDQGAPSLLQLLAWRGGETSHIHSCSCRHCPHPHRPEAQEHCPSEGLCVSWTSVQDDLCPQDNNHAELNP